MAIKRAGFLSSSRLSIFVLASLLLFECNSSIGWISEAAAQQADDIVTGSLSNPVDDTDAPSDTGGAIGTEGGQLIVLGFVGDLGFSGHGQALSKDGAVRHGRIIPWTELTSGVAPLLKADATFANLETVITDRIELSPVDKAFNFAASSTALGEMTKVRINALTAANNHAADFGTQGIQDTLKHLAAAKDNGLKAYAGLGKGTARYTSDVFYVGSTSIALGAIGIGINPEGSAGMGQPLYGMPSDLDRVRLSLRETAADIRVLSVHYNQERNLLPAESDRKRLRSVIDNGDATIVFGHHSHVASGIEKRGSGLILYGLGNFMHAGTRDMGPLGQCRDFGIHVLVYLWAMPNREPIIRAVEITPITDMHDIPKPLPAREAATRIALVNAMNKELSDDTSAAIEFKPTGTGSGLACFEDSGRYGDELADRCSLQSLPTAAQNEAPSVRLSSCNPVPSPVVAATQPRKKATAAKTNFKSASSSRRQWQLFQSQK